jgi:DNA-binding winged helix-turn-helix (wHTH) protein/TolB-like protein/tetratricopeptide (TPR) repeat protein
MSTESGPLVVEFGPFVLDTHQRLLTRSGEVVALEPKVIDTLVVLVEAEGRLVTKQDFMERVWPGTFVEEGSLSRNVSALRRALGDTPDASGYIETVPRRGYRFRFPVRTASVPILPSGSASSDFAPASSEAARERPRAGVWAAPRRIALYGVATLLLATTSGALWRALDGGEMRVNEVRSMAVLPLHNFTGRADLEFVADGTTEELISTLAQIPLLRVVGHRSVLAYKASTKSAGAIAHELGVDVVLEGAVRESNGRLRLSTELIDAASGTSLWARTREGSVRDLLAIQGETATAVAEFVARGDRARTARVSRPRTTNPAAYEEILRGQSFSWRDFDADARRAIVHFQRATELDPQSAIAHAYLSGGWASLTGSSGIEPARQAASRALALDPDSSEAHMAVADVHYRNHDWEAGFAESRRALTLNPNSADACYCFVVSLGWTGRDREALAVAQQGVTLSPRSAHAHEALGHAFYWARKYPDAIPPFRRALDLDPNMHVSRVLLAHALAYEGRSKESIALLDIPPLRRTTFMAFMKLHAGRRDEGLRLLRELTAATPPIESILMAVAWASFGDHEQAISWLTRAIESRESRAASIINQEFDALRADPRFDTLVKRLKMPASYYAFLHAHGAGASSTRP